MMKYKVGDRVRIRRDLSEDIEFVNEKMLSYAGELATITRTYYPKEAYDVDIDEGDWVWHDSMFEDVDTEGQKMNKRVVIEVEGDKIVARCGDKEGAVRCHPGKDFYAGAKIALERLKESDKPYGWLKEGMRYYVPEISNEDLYDDFIYGEDKWDHIFMKRGVVFKTKEEAIECAKKMLAVVKQEG